MGSTLLKGLTVLEALARSSRPRSASELARELNLPRSNVHRTLQTLSVAGYARLGAEGRGYECTMKLFELSSAVMDHVDVRKCATAHIARLGELTQETVHLSVLDGGDAIFLDRVESPQPVRAYSRIGGRAPAHCVATGKALLSWLPDAGLEAVLSGGLSAWTESTITDPEALRRDLARARETGCAINRGEWRISVGGFGAVVFDADGAPAAAVGISGPLERVLPEESRYREAVLGTVREISRELGCRSYPVAAVSGPVPLQGWQRSGAVALRFPRRLHPARGAWATLRAVAAVGERSVADASRRRAPRPRPQARPRSQAPRARPALRACPRRPTAGRRIRRRIRGCGAEPP
jgi:DNA-binding IclR family transcriptional regulator